MAPMSDAIFLDDTRGWTTPQEFPGGYVMRLPVLMQVADEPREGFTTSIEYSYSPDGPKVTTVSVTSTDHPVNGEILRQVRVAELGRENLRQVITRFGEPAVPPGDVIEERKAAGMKSGHTLALVQSLYQYAELTGTPAAKFVAETLGLSIATAGRWIRRSKDALQWGSDDA